MIKKLYNELIEGTSPRQTLSALRKEVKELSRRDELAALIEKDSSVITALLKNDDAKTRKNAALLMGDLEIPTFTTPLFAGYETEQTLFVRSAYLEALAHLDCSEYLDKLKTRLNELAAQTPDASDKKHVDAEIRALSNLILSMEGTTKHTFTGYHEKYHCILLTNRLHREITASQIEHGTLKDYHAGVMVTTDDIEELLYIRTYSELLFVIPQASSCSMEPLEAAQTLADSQLLPLLKKAHREPAPFYFRIDVKGRMPLDQKSRFTKKLSAELERLSGRELLNTTSHYELELRLIENKSGTFNVLLKLNTLPDERFSYRKESVAASIKPVNAALLVALAKDYMVKDAQILDPFCGVATMLIERQMVVKGNTSYGIDVYPDAIDKAKINTEAAGQIIHFINKDCLDFTHDYLFDEIFTDMPFETGHKSDEEIYELYDRFFEKSRDLLTEEGTLILYSRNPEYIRSLSKKYKYEVIKDWLILDKEDSHLFVLR
ncbi:TRM11 family SAM-dependent methyltransferase [Hespellia stercorisuis]|uniref:Putative RNA methylase family UPF0020 n=1 Tax=Hespellia stercorisuis DSM 15480 TaxID=1121950 RepID=A0A1M6WCW5_9FIRM|nr:methyltransferase [Hespellia stercorisuis]SHK91582.1 Putative RNA methylase family UPF0020 [Hespellia stercorisuis DSM 15480]